MMRQVLNGVLGVERPFSRPADLTRKAATVFAGMAGPILIMVAATPFYLERLGPTAFGTVALIWTAVTMLSEFGAGRATTHFVARALSDDGKQQAAAAVRKAIRLQILLGSILGAVLFFSAAAVTAAIDPGAELRAETQTALELLALVTPAFMMTAVLRGTLEALRRFDWIGGVTFTVTGLAYLAPIPFVLNGAGLFEVVSAAILARLIGLATMGWLVFRALPVWTSRQTANSNSMSTSISNSDSKYGHNAVLRFAGWSTLSALATPVLLYLDRILLAVFVSVTALAYYAPAFEAATRLLLIPMSVASVLFPAISASKSRQETTKQSAQALGLILSVLVGPVILVVGLAPDLLSWWLGPSASAAAPALRVLGAGILLNGLAYVPFALLQGRGRADLPALVHLGELPVHVIVAVILVQRFGALGAALAWTVRVSLDCCVLWLLVWRMRLLDRAAWPVARTAAAAACALSFVLAAAWASAQAGAYTRWLGTAAALAGAIWCMLRWRSRAGAEAAFSTVDPARS